MFRSRSFLYIVGSVLIILTLYALLPLSSSKSEILKNPYASLHETEHTRPDTEYTKPDPVPTEEGLPAEGVSENDDPPSAPDHSPVTKPAASGHKIDTLIQEADQQFEKLLAKQTHTLEEAAAAYRKRRGRHPPPGFDHWYKYAKDHNAIVVEEFWDQVYHDLNPFWAIEPAMIRTQARKLGMGAEVQGGKVVQTADWFWHEIWGRMIDTVAQYLPDMFVAMNPMDESRLLVRWETMTELIHKADSEKKLAKPQDVIQKVNGWALQGKDPDYEAPPENWNGFNPYNYARRACPPDSPARQVPGVLSPEEVLQYRSASHPRVSVEQYFDKGFVSNYTEASDFCSDATIGGLHGALMMPLTCENSDVLMPMFGGSKFHVNNEILLPAPMYWNGEERFGGDGLDPTPWAKKQDKVVWRGTATGGRNKPWTWYMFHRHRFIAMTNGTRYSHAGESGHDLIFNEFLRETAIESLRPEIQKNFADWLKSTHNTAFTDLVCDENEPEGTCWYTDSEFIREQPIHFTEQFATKYLPDIDGNSFSGRYRAFLLSNSLPIKATIYREWHDSRLMAWRHFVPMNNRFSDYYRIMEYFVGDAAQGIAGNDKQAEKIALEGRKWGEKVLRKADMQLYVFRVLLEYGRLTDDRRLNLGWVADLVAKGSPGESASE